MRSEPRRGTDPSVDQVHVVATTLVNIEHEDPAWLAESPAIEVRRATGAVDWGQARELILEYLTWVHAAGRIDPFAAQPWLSDELVRLEDWYRPPRGALILASLDRAPVGVVAVSTHAEGRAEMKRLYVRPAARGHHLGERLTWAAITAARDLGCHTLRLETMPDLMQHAVAIYRRLGFHPVDRFDDTAIDGLLYLERPLAARSEPARSWRIFPPIPTHIEERSSPC
jgi:ribosomal protein S18 acetylase RimI-like enzyme